MEVAASEFKKTYRVYAVVGAACANTQFRRKLFGAFDAHSIDKLRSEVDRFLSLSGDPEPHASIAELAMLWSFVGPRMISAALLPPLQGEWHQLAATTMTFEAACDAFSNSVCPHWPCDDAS
jgi:hypothetical protein